MYVDAGEREKSDRNEIEERETRENGPHPSHGQAHYARHYAELKHKQKIISGVTSLHITSEDNCQYISIYSY